MNILVCNYEYPPLGGGGGVATNKCAEGWVKAGHGVTVITSKGPGLPDDEVKNGVRIIRAPVLRTERATASLLSMALYNPSGWLSSRSKRFEFDVVSTHFSIPSGPLGHWLARCGRTPNVLTVYGADIYDPTRFSPKDNFLLKRLNDYLLNIASALIAESCDIRAKALEYYAVRKPIEVIPLPYSPVAFSPVPREALGLCADRRYLVSVGRLVRRKAFDCLIEALAQLPEPRLELLLIGDGPELESLRRLAAGRGLADRVHFLGYQPEERKFQYLACADLYVLSSEHEGFGIVLQEAMQAGLPIVATNNGGQVDFLEEGRNALLVTPRDPTALAAAIGRLMADRSLMERMGVTNRADITRFDIEKVCSAYLAIFRRVLDEQRA